VPVITSAEKREGIDALAESLVKFVKNYDTISEK